MTDTPKPNEAQIEAVMEETIFRNEENGYSVLSVRAGRSEVTVVGDSFYKDILPAKKAGCRTIWFKGEGWTDETYDESIPDQVITDLSQVINELT